MGGTGEQGGSFTTANEVRTSRALSLGYRVRAIEPADAPRVAEIHVRVWRQAYADLMPADVLETLDVERFERTWRDRLAGDRAPETVNVVGVHPDRGIVGFGSAGPSRDDDAPCSWELYAINVLASEHGSGVSDLLMWPLVADRSTYLWVLAGNERAQAFYARYGFGPDGGTKVRPDIGRAEQRLVRSASRAAELRRRT